MGRLRGKLVSSIRSSLLKLANEICRKHGKPPNQKIAVAVFLETGRWLVQKDCWAWLAEEYGRRTGRTISAPDGKKPGRILKGGKARKVRDHKLYVQKKPGTEFYASPEWRTLRFEVLREHDGRCELCGRSHRTDGVVMHVDHIKPRSKFPALELVKSNLQVLCADCNMGKGNRDDTDWRRDNDTERELDKIDWRIH